MFPSLRAVRSKLQGVARRLVPDALSSVEAAEAIKELTAIEKHAAGMRIRLAKRIDDEDLLAKAGKRDAAEWLAGETGQAASEARKDLETSKRLDQLPATDEAVKRGELSATQAHSVTDAAAVDPAAEQDLLDTARNEPVGALRRKAKTVKAAATDDEAKRDAAQRNRKLRMGTDDETLEGWGHFTGPASVIAELKALLRPYVEAEFRKARAQGRHEPEAARWFDALLAAVRVAAGAADPDVARAARTAGRILARVDVSAMRRGRTVAGETCELDGIGPCSVADLRALLPDSIIEIILTDGVDAWNITNLSRRATARQHVVLDWLGVMCSNLDCDHTQHLQVDHDIDWATVGITELVNLDWLCPHCHRLKTHRGWKHVGGRGRRPFVPPDHPDQRGRPAA